MHTRTQTCAYADTCTDMHTYTGTHMYTCMHTSTPMHTHTHSIHAYIQTCAQSTHAHTHARTAHTYTHVSMHTCTAHTCARVHTLCTCSTHIYSCTRMRTHAQLLHASSFLLHTQKRQPWVTLAGSDHPTPAVPVLEGWPGPTTSCSDTQPSPCPRGPPASSCEPQSRDPVTHVR